MKARFLGETSCGFETGCVYDIDAQIKNNLIYVTDNKGNGMCPYVSMEMVLENWKIIAIKGKFLE